MKRTNKIKSVIALTLALLGSGMAQAEVNKVVFGHQTGWAYMPLYVMQEQKLVEKHAKALGVEVTAEYKQLGTPKVIIEGMKNNEVDFGVVGIPSLITLNDQSEGEYKAFGAVTGLPMYLATYKDYKTVCDIKPTDKIGVPSVGVSVQAVTLQMATEKECGDAHKYDKQTVGMAHPVGLSNLFAGNIQLHFAGPPYQDMELKHQQMKKLVSSYDILGWGSSFISMTGTETFAKKNPKVQQAVYEALVEAQEFVTKNKGSAVATYISIEKPKNQTDSEIQDDTMNAVFNITPKGFEEYSKFMFKEKAVKTQKTWKELTFKFIHELKGS